MLGLLTAVASLAAEHRLWSTGASVVGAPGLQSTDSAAVAHGLQSTDSAAVAQELSCSNARWDLARPGMELTSLALAGGFFNTEPAGKLSGIF